jgi:uncharacterized membrane protein YeiH
LRYSGEVNPLLLLDYAGVAVFAATGALAASRKELDIVGFLFLASVTGIGGGTFRDLILDVPVFWVQHPPYLLICAGIAILAYFTSHLVESRYRLLLWFDAIGVSAYSVLGADKGLEVTGSPIVAIVTGVLTGTFGGILRDLLAGEPSVLLRPEIYVTAAIVGALMFTAADLVGFPPQGAAVIAFIAAFLVRGGALKFGWTFPRYKSRPGRKPGDIR